MLDVEDGFVERHKEEKCRSRVRLEKLAEIPAERSNDEQQFLSSPEPTELIFKRMIDDRIIESGSISDFGPSCASTKLLEILSKWGRCRQSGLVSDNSGISISPASSTTFSNGRCT